MTVRDLANDFLDLPVWEALIVWFIAVFLFGFFNALIREVSKWRLGEERVEA